MILLQILTGVLDLLNYLPNMDIKFYYAIAFLIAFASSFSYFGYLRKSS